MSSSSGEHKLVFGAASLGMAYGLPRAGDAQAQAITEDDVSELVEHALALGIDTFDTAPGYGESEVRLGTALSGRARVWTKVATGDASTSLDQSLVRLRRDTVDLFQWHNWTAELGRDPAWCSGWERVRKRNGAKAFGATTYGRTDAVAAIESGMFDVVQVEYNLINQSVVEAIGALATSSVKVAVRSVYLQGALTTEGRALPPLPRLVDGVRRAREAASGGLTELALQTALDHQTISYVLVGIDRREQLDEAIRIARGARAKLAPEALRALDLRGDPATDPRAWPR